MAHSLFCSCKKCNPSMMDALFGSSSRKKGDSFSKNLSNGTNIYGSRSAEKKPGYKHGHKGNNFHRTPHSTIGSAAIGRPHTSKGHKTNRW